MSLLAVEGLAVEVGGKPLLRGLDLRLAPGELLGLVGPNGAGKSTLVKAIAQLLRYRGEIRLQGRALRTIAPAERARLLAYLSQDDQLQWPIAVQDLVALGRHPYRGSWWRGAGTVSVDDRRAIKSALQATDTWSLRTRRVTELSGGERARARLARALAVDAPLLLADEPVAALDPRHQLDVMTRLRAHCDAGASLVLVLHDLTLASRFCDRLLLLHQGREVACGRPETVLTEGNLERVYGIRAIRGSHQGAGYLVPWCCAGSEGAA